MLLKTEVALASPYRTIQTMVQCVWALGKVVLVAGRRYFSPWATLIGMDSEIVARRSSRSLQAADFSILADSAVGLKRWLCLTRRVSFARMVREKAFAGGGGLATWAASSDLHVNQT